VPPVPGVLAQDRKRGLIGIIAPGAENLERGLRQRLVGLELREFTAGCLIRGMNCRRGELRVRAIDVNEGRFRRLTEGFQRVLKPSVVHGCFC
jgi:hypothetical protein